MSPSLNPNLKSDLAPIARSLAAGGQNLKVSFEFFPPKTEEMETTLWESIRRLAPLNPEFVSVTYGAGGSTRERTHRTVKRILDETHLKPAAHLTCVDASRDEVDEVIRAYWEAGVRHVVALRGDPPSGFGDYKPRNDGYQNATELTAAIKRIGDFEVSVGVYPEKHPQSPSLAFDLDVLRQKVDAGATRGISQFFFEPATFLRFRDAVADAGIRIDLTPGIMPVTNFKGLRRMSAACEAAIPDWLGELFEGLDDDADTRKLLASAVAVELCLGLEREGVENFHFYTLNRADLVFAIGRILGLKEKPRSSSEAVAQGETALKQRSGSARRKSMTRTERIAALKQGAKERILILDGSWGVMIQRRGLDEADFLGERFKGHKGQMKGNNDILCLTRPDIIADLHNQYYAAGADISETNTFSATTIAQDDYHLDLQSVIDINREGAKIARQVADEWTAREPHKPRFVAGSIGPLNKMLSMSSDVNDPGARLVTFDQVYQAYREQVAALYEGGVDLYLIETITDTLNCKAAIKAILDLEDDGQEALPIWISGTITDRSGRTLSGQTAEAFWNSVRHAKPFAVGFNCALGADLMRPHIAELSRVADCLVAAYPNAGLPNAMGQYDEQPHETAHELHEWAKDGIVNILGGCCGTTPDHIKHVADEVAGITPRQIPERPKALRLAGLEPFELT